ncbi:MAG: sensor histidine kinase, partial [Flavisolibacter sp.]
SSKLTELKKLVKDNPAQSEHLRHLSEMINSEMPVLMQKNVAEIVETHESFRLERLLRIHQLINEVIANEERVLRERKVDLVQSTKLNNLLTVVFAVLAIGIIVVTFLSNLFLSRQQQWLEGFLGSILDTSQNGIVHYKAIRENGKIVDFRLEFLNKSIDRLLKIDSAQMRGKRLSEFPSYVRETGLIHRYIEVVETGNPQIFEWQYERGDINTWFQVSLSKLEDGVIISFNDISQLKKYEEELKENISDLERSNAELEQYAYVASHDLQEPLRKIRSFGSFLQETQGPRLDEKGRMQLEKILAAAERMSSLIKDILSFSSLKKSVDFVPTNLNEVLKGVLQDLDLVIVQKNVRVKSDLLPTIDAIPLQMTQLFYNLLNNSLKFAHEDRRPLIHIGCRKIKEEELPPSLFKNKTYYEFIFSDNGIGFNEEYAEQIFGLFKRLNDKNYYPGSGIGLALCKKVVQNHHGEIIAKGKENEGASFFIYLPEKQ